MKTTTIFHALIISALIISGCKKEETAPETETPTPTITGDDAADLIAITINSGASGFTGSASDASQNTSTVSTSPTACLYSKDTSFVKTNSTASMFTFSYNLNFKYQMYCQGGSPQNMTFSISATGNTDSSPLKTTGVSNGTLTLTGFPSTNTVYTLNGSYSRTGNATSKLRDKNTFNYTVTLSVTNVQISKTNYNLLGGTCAVTVVATTTGGQSFNFGGTLTYVSPTSATLTIGTKTYTLNLPTGIANS